MKIAYVSGMVEPTGGDHILYHHVLGLRKLNHEVDAYFSGWHPSYKNTLKDWNSPDDGKIKFYQYGDIGKINFSSYDLVVANGLYGAVQALSIDHPRKAWFCQNFDPYVFGSSKDIDKVYQQYDNFILYSQSLKKIIKYYYGDKNFVLCNNGVEYSRFKDFQKCNFIQNKRICFMVAYYRNYKGTQFANKIFSGLKDRGFVTVEINVVGGPLVSTMEYYRDPSWIKKSQIVSGCDINIHPSVFETWNLTSMESMALGTPVVGVNSGGIMEYATKDNSIIFEERRVDLICNAIQDLYRDQTRYLGIQKNGIQTAKDHDWDVIMPQIEDSYRKLLTESTQWKYLNMYGINLITEGHLGGYTKEEDPRSKCKKLWDWSIPYLGIKSVLDIGCADGKYMKYFDNLGCYVFGIEGSKKAISDNPIKDRVFQIDLCEKPYKSERFYDMIWCCEVVEHIEEKYVQNVIDTLKNGKYVFMTHAIPNQEGYHHVNCKPSGYWIALMTKNGFTYNDFLTQEARKREPDTYFGRTGLIFERQNK